jgi:hypothetical protein
MGAGESAPHRRTSKLAELPAGVPPLSKIHLANPPNDQTQFQLALKVDPGSDHRATCAVIQGSQSKPAFDGVDEVPW